MGLVGSQPETAGPALLYTPATTMPIATFRLLSVAQPVGSGVSNAVYVGVSGVAKAHTIGRYTVANEWVAAELAKLLRLPIPPSFVTPSEDGGKYFVSLDFSLARESLPPVSPTAVVNARPELSARIIVFDALTANCDRHNGNLAMHPVTGDVMVFDHSHAIFGGGPAGSGPQWLGQVQDDLGIFGSLPDGAGRGNRHCLVDHVTSAAELLSAADRVARLDPHVVREIAKECCEFDVPPDEAHFLGEFLVNRCTRLRDVLTHAMPCFPRLGQGSLL